MKSTISRSNIETETVRNARKECNDASWLHWAALEDALSAAMILTVDLEIIDHMISWYLKR